MKDEAIDRRADILGGTPVFSGTRVPVRILIEYLGGRGSGRRLPGQLPYGVAEPSSRSARTGQGDDQVTASAASSTAQTAVSESLHTFQHCFRHPAA